MIWLLIRTAAINVVSLISCCLQHFCCYVLHLRPKKLPQMTCHTLCSYTAHPWFNKSPRCIEEQNFHNETLSWNTVMVYPFLCSKKNNKASEHLFVCDGLLTSKPKVHKDGSTLRNMCRYTIISLRGLFWRLLNNQIHFLPTGKIKCVRESVCVYFSTDPSHMYISSSNSQYTLT